MKRLNSRFFFAVALAVFAIYLYLGITYGFTEIQLDYVKENPDAQFACFFIALASMLYGFVVKQDEKARRANRRRNIKQLRKMHS